MLLSVLDVILRYMMLSSAKCRMGIECCCLCNVFIYSRNRTGHRTEPCGTPGVSHVLSHEGAID